MTESALLRRILLRLTELGFRVFRNNVGVLQDKNGQFVRYGVCNPGGSDIIGWRTITATEGQRVAQFVAVEVKTPTGKVSKEQANFINQVKAAGGYAEVVRSEEELS
jgi:hypothetical protein